MATASISVFIAALETLYVTIDGRGEPLVAATDDIDVILHPPPVITAEGLVAGAQAGSHEPPRCSRMTGTTCLRHCISPVTLIDISVSHVSRRIRVRLLSPSPTPLRPAGRG